MFSPNYNPPTKNLVLTASEVKNVWIKLADVALETNLNILPIREFIDNLLGYPFGPCWTSRCDYMTTIVKMILPDGEIGPCDRCLQDGVRCRSLNPISLRSENLRNTDCKGCRYFEICGGGCPGETIDSDIRNKTKGCEAIYGVYSYLENRLRSMFPKIYLPGVDEPDWYNKSRNSKRDPSLWNKNMTFSVWRNGGQKRD
jgi:radical SAM protein with 4Fe4S-binding SPASM domain